MRLWDGAVDPQFAFCHASVRVQPPLRPYVCDQRTDVTEAACYRTADPRCPRISRCEATVGSRCIWHLSPKCSAELPHKLQQPSYGCLANHQPLSWLVASVTGTIDVVLIHYAVSVRKEMTLLKELLQIREFARCQQLLIATFACLLPQIGRLCQILEYIASRAELAAI